MVPSRIVLEGLLAAFGGMGWVNQAGMKGNGKLVKPSAGWEKGPNQSETTRYKSPVER